MKSITLHIEAMSCGHCLNAVNQAIASVPGAKPIAVRMGRADIEYDESLTSPANIAETVRAAGYPATPIGS
ncbi:MAG TPA: cation transporter [Gemmatimonadales bacterium]|jgi:copper chaperone CopZ|nr:cation transporter [Gemmatimonadales bacterium]